VFLWVLQGVEPETTARQAGEFAAAVEAGHLTLTRFSAIDTESGTEADTRVKGLLRSAEETFGRPRVNAVRDMAVLDLERRGMNQAGLALPVPDSDFLPGESDALGF
jgi:hypothetical protein